MKKYFLFIAFLMGSGALCCQGVKNVFKTDTEGGKKKKYGPAIRFHGGMNFSGVGGESESYTGTLPGVYFGAGVNLIDLSDVVSVNAGLLYSQQGSNYKSYQYIPGGESTTGNAAVRMNYLALPVTARYQAKKGFYAEAGLRPGLLLSAKDKHDGRSDDIKSDYKSFDMGLLFGVGYEFQQHFGVGLSYYPGLVNINKVSTLKDRNRNISFGVFYKL